MAQQPASVFEEVQRIQPLRTKLLLLTMPLFLTGISIRQILLKHPWGKQPMSNGALIFWTLFLWLIFVRLSTVRLVVQVGSGVLSIGLRGLWKARRIAVSQIANVKTLQFNAMRDFGGYGIRSTPHGKAYVAEGNSGVRVELRNKNVLIIGSRHADQLAAALNQR